MPRGATLFYQKPLKTLNLYQSQKKRKTWTLLIRVEKRPNLVKLQNPFCNSISALVENKILDSMAF